MDDKTVSLKEVLVEIDAMPPVKAEGHDFIEKTCLKTRLELLPSAQPNLDEWCRDCKEYDKERHSCPRWNRVIRQTVEDLKAEALPERKKGTWIFGEDEYGIDGYHCDQCGFFVPWDYAHKFINYIEDYYFCPHCMADMRGDDHGTD